MFFSTLVQLPLLRREHKPQPRKIPKKNSFFFVPFLGRIWHVRKTGVGRHFSFPQSDSPIPPTPFPQGKGGQEEDDLTWEGAQTPSVGRAFAPPQTPSPAFAGLFRVSSLAKRSFVAFRWRSTVFLGALPFPKNYSPPSSAFPTLLSAPSRLPVGARFFPSFSWSNACCLI